MYVLMCYFQRGWVNFKYHQFICGNYGFGFVVLPAQYSSCTCTCMKIWFKNYWYLWNIWIRDWMATTYTLSLCMYSYNMYFYIWGLLNSRFVCIHTICTSTLLFHDLWLFSLWSIEVTFISCLCPTLLTIQLTVIRIIIDMKRKNICLIELLMFFSLI